MTPDQPHAESRAETPPAPDAPTSATPSPDPRDAGPPPVATRRLLLAGLAAIVLSLALYLPSYTGDFVFDTYHHLEANPRIQQLAPPLDYFRGASGRRGLATWSFALNDALHGPSPAGYRITNAILHGLAGFALLLLLLEVARLPAVRPRLPRGWPVIVGVITLLWLVHPLQAAAVAYIIQRAEAMAGLAILLTLWLYIRAAITRPLAPWLGLVALAVLTASAGMLSKEVAYLLPLMLLAFDRTLCHGAPNRFWARRAPVLVLVTITLALPLSRGFADVTGSRDEGFGALVAELVRDVAREADADPTARPSVTAADPRRDGLTTDEARPRTATPARILILTDEEIHDGLKLDGIPPGAYLFSQPPVLLHYLLLTVAPIWMSLDYEWAAFDTIWPIPDPLRDAFVLAAFGFVVAIAVLSLWGVVRRRWLGLPGVMFFLLLAPSSSFFPLPDLAFEHRMYTALAAVLTAIVVPIGVWASRSTPRARLAAATAVVVAATFAGITVDRAFHLRSKGDAWASVVRAMPNSARGHVNLAAYYSGEQDLETAYEHAWTAMRLRPASDSVHRRVGTLLLERGELERAGAHLKLAYRIRPTSRQLSFSLGRYYYRTGDLEAAEEAFRRVVSGKSGGHVGAYLELAVVLWDLGRDDEVEPLLIKAVEVAPGNPSGWITYGNFLLAAGRLDEALDQYRGAIEAAPQAVPPRLALARAMLDLGEVEPARSLMRETLRLAPEHPGVLRQMGETLLHADEPAAAVDLLHRASQKRGPRQVAEALAAARRLGWTLATWPDPAIRDAELALAIGANLSELPARTAFDLELHAAALANAGRFDPAAAWQRQAIAMAREDSAAGADLPAMARRLEAYTSGRAWREKPEAGAAAAPAGRVEAPGGVAAERSPARPVRADGTR